MIADNGGKGNQVAKHKMHAPDDMFFLDRIERISRDADQRTLAAAGTVPIFA